MSATVKRLTAGAKGRSRYGRPGTGLTRGQLDPSDAGLLAAPRHRGETAVMLPTDTLIDRFYEFRLDLEGTDPEKDSVTAS